MIHSYIVGPSRTGACTLEPGSGNRVTASASVFMHRSTFWSVRHTRPAPGCESSTRCTLRLPGALPSSAHCRRSEEHTSELQSRFDLVCRLLLEKKKYEYID